MSESNAAATVQPEHASGTFVLFTDNAILIILALTTVLSWGGVSACPDQPLR